MRKLIAGLKILGLALNCIFAIPFQKIVLLFAKGKAAYFMPQLWHKITCRVLGLKFEVIGKPETKKQVFFVGNHLSHFDIFILGSLIRASFVAKEELAHWPLIGTLSRLQQTAFISRSAGQAAKVRNNVQGMIDNGRNIILFPEGTSTRGDTVLDFKSTLFSLPLQYADKGLYIQPFTLRLISVDGKPASSPALKDLYAWDRDNTIEIGPHIWNFAQTRGATLQVIFHPLVAITPGEDRKALAKRIYEIVAAPLEQSVVAV